MNRPSPEDMKAMQVMEYVTELEMKNKKLKEEVKNLKLIIKDNESTVKQYIKDRDEFRELYNKAKEDVVRLSKENKELKEKLMLTENDRDEREVKARDMMKENKELKKKLEHYENTRAIQESNDASRWKPWCMSYVDRELNYLER